MAKRSKSTKHAKKTIEKIVFDEILPQNIMPMGEKVEEDKNIYVSQSVYKEIHAFTKNKLTNESGGMLIGNVIEAFGKTNIVIHGFIEAKFSEGTPTTLKFTHETWDYVHEQMDKKYENGQIIGWIHTHPNFGIFLSEYDRFIQNNFFKEDYQIAYVVDPIQHIEGFYFWVNEKIERCKGFYIFDKTGNPIEIETEQDIEETEREKRRIVNGVLGLSNYIMLSIMIIVIIVAVLWGNNLKNRMAILETQQENLVFSANQSIGYLEQVNVSLEMEISSLNDRITELEEANKKFNEEMIEGLSDTEKETGTSDDIIDGDDAKNGLETTDIGAPAEESTEEENDNQTENTGLEE